MGKLMTDECPEALPWDPADKDPAVTSIVAGALRGWRLEKGFWSSCQ